MAWPYITPGYICLHEKGSWGLPSDGVCLPHGIVGRQTLCQQTNKCENITFPHIHLRAGITPTSIIPEIFLIQNPHRQELHLPEMWSRFRRIGWAFRTQDHGTFRSDAISVHHLWSGIWVWKQAEEAHEGSLWVFPVLFSLRKDNRI